MEKTRKTLKGIENVQQNNRFHFHSICFHLKLSILHLKLIFHSIKDAILENSIKYHNQIAICSFRFLNNKKHSRIKNSFFSNERELKKLKFFLGWNKFFRFHIKSKSLHPQVPNKYQKDVNENSDEKQFLIRFSLHY